MTSEEMKIKKEFEDQLQLLSELSEKGLLTTTDRVAISTGIKAVCLALFGEFDTDHVHDDSADYSLK